jgi:hypothetical protein
VAQPNPLTDRELDECGRLVADNGFREGDHVRLTEPFVNDEVRFEAGRTGVVLVIGTAPAQIRLARSTTLHEILIQGPDGRLIGVLSNKFELIPGKSDVLYDGDSVSCSVRFSDGDRVEFDRSVKIGAAVYYEGTPATIRFPQSPETRARLASNGIYPLMLEDGEVEVVPGTILRLAP